MKVFLLRILSLLVTLSLLTGCQKDTSNSFSETTNATFEEFTNQLFLEEITSNTLQMHYSIEDPAAFGIHDYKISLGNFSQETREASSTYLNETLTKVLSFDTSMLSLENQLTHDILVDSLNSQISLSKYDLYREPLSPSGGLHMELPILFAEYAFHREQDVKDYLKLIALADEYFDQLMTFEAEKSNNGLFMSSSMCQLIIDSCKDFLLNKEQVVAYLLY